MLCPYLVISINELLISINELLISINELLISINELLISINELSISISELLISINELLISIISFNDINKYGLNVKTAAHSYDTGCTRIWLLYVELYLSKYYCPVKK